MSNVLIPIPVYVASDQLTAQANCPDSRGISEIGTGNVYHAGELFGCQLVKSRAMLIHSYHMHLFPSYYTTSDRNSKDALPVMPASTSCYSNILTWASEYIICLTHLATVNIPRVRNACGLNMMHSTFSTGQSDKWSISIQFSMNEYIKLPRDIWLKISS